MIIILFILKYKKLTPNFFLSKKVIKNIFFEKKMFFLIKYVKKKGIIRIKDL